METLTTVAAVSPAAPYLGGKRNLARRLVDRIGTIPHTTYVEPFVGMGGVFLRRTARPRAEVINDLSGDVATLFRVLQEHYPYFIDMLRWRLTSRAEFDRLRALPGDRLTDLQRAARFLYLQRLAFGGKVKGQHFGVSRANPGRFDVTKLEPMLADIHERLAGVVIEQLPYAEVIRRYDGPETLFYLDPPYWGCEADYGDGFARDDFERLADQLAAISGRFILSINDTPGAREVFGRFAIDEAETTWTVGTAAAGAGKRVTELIVFN
ncbi:DNA adenine methylase [Sphingomonas solaris]|uniref:site-specific DNA-methyltransferase (adenine-specific) n=1 Tax=Alterirhizorhabdus solaris TaxID=2529389 RepID=A0A558R821_9SPHN|nr:DNA adenine methylase [Sphingomonas solaris]TVV75534.1 DNA adenine methylase [Sphingomonas solaris]